MRDDASLSENRSVSIFCDSAFIILIFSITYLCMRRACTDYNDHLLLLPKKTDVFHPLAYFAKNSEPLWHYCVKFFYWIFKVPVGHSGAVVCGLCNVVTYKILGRYFSGSYKGHGELAAFVLMIVGPLYIPWFNPNIYLGQGSPNVWHNPTTLMVKPFAVYVALKGLIIMETPFTFSDFKAKNKEMAFFAFVMILSALAKPSFIQIFFPAIFVFCVIKVIVSDGNFFPNSVWLLICCMPTFVLFLLQFLHAFFQNPVVQVIEGVPPVGIKLFYVMRIYSPNPLFSQFLAIAFPISVFLCKLINKTKFSEVYKFTWLMYSFSFLEAALFVENHRPGDGNFGWGLVLGDMFVFMSAIVELVDMVRGCLIQENCDSRLSISVRICSSLLCFHVLVGIIWICRIIFLRTYA